MLEDHALQWIYNSLIATVFHEFSRFTLCLPVNWRITRDPFSQSTLFTGQFTDHARSLLPIHTVYRSIHGSREIPSSPDPRQSWILDFTLWIPDSRYWIPDPLSVGFWFRNPIVSGILKSLRSIPESKARDSWFPKKKFPGFGNPNSLTQGGGGGEMVDERQKRCSSLIEVGWFRHALSAS